MNIFYFSNYIKPVGKWIKFIFVVIGRFFKILFRRRKDLALLQLSYSEKYLFNSSYLIICYQFKNALWYHLKNIKKTTNNAALVLNLKCVQEVPIEFVIYGFFRKKIVFITAIAGNAIERTLFTIEWAKINRIKRIGMAPICTNSRLVVTIPEYFLVGPNIRTNFSYRGISHSLFTQNDFI